MPVLLMAQGDPKAKDLLRRAIEARYGQRPPALDTLHTTLKGKTPGKVGPFPMRLSVKASVHVRFSTALRWEWQAGILGMGLQHGLITLGSGSSRPNEAAQVTSEQAQLWAVAALMLTPLGDMDSKLSLADAQSFEAVHTKTNASVRLLLRPDFSLESVQTECVNPATGQPATLSFHLSSTLMTLNDINVPAAINVYWDDALSFELTPVSLESNPTLADDLFSSR